MNQNTKRTGSSALTVVIIVLAVLLVGAIGFICYMLFGGGLNKDGNGDGDKDKISAATSGAPLEETPPDAETQALYDTVVMKIGDFEFDYETYRYYFLSGMKDYDGGNRAYWKTSEGASSLATLRKDIQKELLRLASVQTLAAKKGIALTDEKKKEIDDALANVAVQMQAAYGTTMTAMLSSYNMTMNFYKEHALYQELESELYKALTEKESGSVDYSSGAVTEYAKDFFQVKHILYGYNDSLPDEEAKAKAEAAVNVLNGIKNQEERFNKFDELIKSDSNDYQEEGDNFYYYRHGEMDKTFEDAVDALGENEISGVVKTDFGYHVILRLPLDMEFFTENVYPSYKYTEMLEACEETLTVTTTDFYDTITPETAK